MRDYARARTKATAILIALETPWAEEMSAHVHQWDYAQFWAYFMGIARSH
jgi:hypothetical protein